MLTTTALYKRLLLDLRPYMTMKDLRSYRKDPDTFRASHGTQKVRAVILASSFFKKLEATGVQLESRGLLKFLERNHECANWKLHLEDDRDRILFGELKRTLHRFFEPGHIPLADHHSVLRSGGVGPGVSVGSSGQHIYNKLFCGPLTCSRDLLYTLYRHYVKGFPDMDAAEMLRISIDGTARVVRESKLSFVPKDRTTSRVICAEKSLDMFFQLGLGSIVEDRLRSFWGIDLAKQQYKNRELARLGSMDWQKDYSFVTIDLESASDMPLEMCRAVYPNSIMHLLECYRSEYTLIPGLGPFKLDILSSMGNGYTFPMQTTLFAAIILAAYRINGIAAELPFGREVGNLGVNGDDLVFRSDCVDDVLRLLTILGFKVNTSKSFLKGPFRESCGGDYLNGKNVRGVYIKTLDTIESRYSAINRLNVYSALHDICLSRTVSCLIKSVPYRPVPFWENSDAGIRLPFSLATNVAMSKRGNVLFRKRAPVSSGWRFDGTNFVGSRRHVKGLYYNPFGLWLSFLHGSLESGRATLRQRQPVYQTVRACTPCWDYEPSTWLPGDRLESFRRDESPTSYSFIDGRYWERWNTAVYSNL